MLTCFALNKAKICSHIMLTKTIYHITLKLISRCRQRFYFDVDVQNRMKECYSLNTVKIIEIPKKLKNMRLDSKYLKFGLRQSRRRAV